MFTADGNLLLSRIEHLLTVMLEIGYGGFKKKMFATFKILWFWNYYYIVEEVLILNNETIYLFDNND
jgi:hypothetical protein